MAISRMTNDNDVTWQPVFSICLSLSLSVCCFVCLFGWITHNVVNGFLEQCCLEVGRTSRILLTLFLSPYSGPGSSRERHYNCHLLLLLLTYFLSFLFTSSHILLWFVVVVVAAYLQVFITGECSHIVKSGWHRVSTGTGLYGIICD